MCTRLVRVLTLGLIALLAACASSPPQTPAPAPAANAGRYSMPNDSGTLEFIDLAQVKPVVPKPESRTLAGNKSPYTVNGKTYQVLRSEEGYSETGMASWYGRKFHGHLTSNGEIYDMFQLSAAHTSLPIPSYARVTNLDNGKSIVVRVNDRGPFHPGRVIDLSYAGAAMLGYAANGTARVRVEAIVPGRREPATVAVAPVIAQNSTEAVASERDLIDRDAGQEFLQVGAFASLDSARSLMSRLSGMTTMAVFIHTEGSADGAVLHKVRVGPVSSEAQAEQLVNNVKSARLGTPFRVRI